MTPERSSRRFVAKSGPIFWVSDQVEAVFTWEDRTLLSELSKVRLSATTAIKTLFWACLWAVICPSRTTFLIFPKLPSRLPTGSDSADALRRSAQHSGPDLSYRPPERRRLRRAPCEARCACEPDWTRSGSWFCRVRRSAYLHRSLTRRRSYLENLVRCTTTVIRSTDARFSKPSKRSWVS
jgi:hypothetical protein